MDKRRHRVRWGLHGTRSATSESYWNQPYAWNRDAQKAGERRRVFCSSLADVFEDWDGQLVDHKNEPVFVRDGRWSLDPRHSEPLTMTAARTRLWETILRTPWLDWLLLTKRPENILRSLKKVYDFRCEHVLRDNCLKAWIDGTCVPGNVWLGTSVEDRKYGLPRVDEIRKVPAAIRFLSVEPQLEDLGEIDLTGIGWVIVGGESTQGGVPGRPFDLAWARSLRDQCQASGVAYFLKQYGSTPYDSTYRISISGPDSHAVAVNLKDSHGGDWSEWEPSLRVRQLPATARERSPDL